MLAGITLFGVITANLAAFVLEPKSSDIGSTQPSNAELLARIDELAAEVRSLKRADEDATR